MIFIHLSEFSQLSPNFKDAVKNILEAAKKPALFCQTTKCFFPWSSLTAILHWGMLFHKHNEKINPLIDISGYTENFACLRCKQGCKNKRLEIFCKHQTPFSVVV